MTSTDAEGTGPRRKPLRRLGRVVIVALLACALVDAWAIGAGFDYQQVLDDLAGGVDVPYEDAVAADDREVLVSLVQLGVYLISAVVFLAWFRRAYGNLVLSGGHARYGKGWAIGAWFVPLLNFVRPKKMANDLWRGTLPDDVDGRREAQRPVSALLHWWWAGWVLATVLSGAVASAWSSAETLSEQQSANDVEQAADLVSLVAAVLAILVVRRLSARQDAHLAARSEDPPAAPVFLPPQPA